MKCANVFACGLALMLSVRAVFATTIHVPDDQPTIQAGIEACEPGDTILIADGTYYERPIIDRAITLIGESPNGTIINGSGIGDVVFISSNAVHVERLSVTMSGDEIWWDGPWDAGIKIEEADSCVIEFCILHDNGAAGLALSGSSYNKVRNCAFLGNVTGIYLCTDYSLGERDNNVNRIISNYIVGNGIYGISFAHCAGYQRFNIVRDNYVCDNYVGLVMVMSYDNETSYNNFNGNSDYGVAHIACDCGSGSNSFHHNSFLYNNGGLVQARDTWTSPNYWYSLSELEGNYWSDYTGADDDSNGIGDTPYQIDYDYEDSEDPYPLMQSQDLDGDGIIAGVDNCPLAHNPDQADADYDFVGDSCDNCPDIWNPDQGDADGDGLGDMCEEGACGDADNSGLIDIDDVVYMVYYIFAGGPAPIPYESGDADCSGEVDIDDAVWLITYIFSGGNEPCDTTGDDIPDC